MIAAELIRTVEQAGGHLEPDGDGLVVEAPKPLPESIMTELRAHKAEVIDFLTRPVARVVLLHCPPGVPEVWVQGHGGSASDDRGRPDPHRGTSRRTS